jgi:hypothetical protein
VPRLLGSFLVAMHIVDTASLFGIVVVFSVVAQDNVVSTVDNY